MADLGGTFDAEAKENQRVNTCLPAGEYPVVLVGSAKEETKAKDGSFLSLDFQIASGEHQNKHLFERLNLWLPATDEKKKTAIQIAKGQFSELCRAVGVLTPKDSSELHGKPLMVKINAKDEGEFGFRNHIVKFSAKPAMTQQVVPVESVPVPAGASPWSA